MAIAALAGQEAAKQVAQEQVKQKAVEQAAQKAATENVAQQAATQPNLQPLNEASTAQNLGDLQNGNVQKQGDLSVNGNEFSYTGEDGATVRGTYKEQLTQGELNAAEKGTKVDSVTRNVDGVERQVDIIRQKDGSHLATETSVVTENEAMEASLKEALMTAALTSAIEGMFNRE